MWFPRALEISIRKFLALIVAAGCLKVGVYTDDLVDIYIGLTMLVGMFVAVSIWSLQLGAKR